MQFPTKPSNLGSNLVPKCPRRRESKEHRKSRDPWSKRKASHDVYSPGQGAATIVILVSRLSTSLQHERSKTVVGLCHQHARWSKHQASWTKQQRPCTRRVGRNTRAKHPTGRLCKRSGKPSSNMISLRWNICLPKLTNASKMQRKY